jgi:hypothetical protein
MFRSIASGILTTLVLLFAQGSATSAHEARRGAVIVDTDMALDDARALALLARAPSLELLAVVVRENSVQPEMIGLLPNC